MQTNKQQEIEKTQKQYLSNSKQVNAYMPLLTIGLSPFFTGRMPFLPPNQQCQSTEGN